MKSKDGLYTQTWQMDVAVEKVNYDKESSVIYFHIGGFH